MEYFSITYSTIVTQHRHSLSIYDCLEARQISKLQNRRSRPLLNVELYLTAHKYFVSNSLYIVILAWLLVSSQLFLLDGYLITRKYSELNNRAGAQTNINSDKNIIQ